MTAEKNNVCKGGPKLVFACSGAADVGAIADKAARKMTKEGSGYMFCLAGIGGRIDPIMKKTETAERILAIDGCPLNCVKAALEAAGFKQFKHLKLADLGLEKGSSPVNDENVSKVAAAGAALLAG